MQTSVVLLIFLVASTLADHWEWPINKDVSLEEGMVISGDIHVNLIGIADFTITHTSGIQICFQETYPLPLNVSWWESACTFYEKFDGSATPVTNNGTVNLRDEHYNIGIYFLDAPPEGHSENIIFQAGTFNDSCPDNYLWNTVECQVPEELPENYTFTENEPVLFYVDVPELTGFIRFDALNPQAPLELALRRSAAASTDAKFYDGSAGTSAYFELPRPGRYILFARSQINQTVQLNVSMRVCLPDEHGGGPTCQEIYNHNYNSVDSIIGVLDNYFYWVIYTSPEQPLWVSVRANNLTSPLALLPIIIASKGNLPVIGNADIHNCNRENCGVVNSISYIPSANETWYVAVTPQVNGTDYGIWFNSVCSPLCQANGECIDEGSDAGLCVCHREGDIGVACQISDRVSQRFVVLAAIWGTALGVTVIVVVAHFLSSKTPTYERLA